MVNAPATGSARLIDQQFSLVLYLLSDWLCVEDIAQKLLNNLKEMEAPQTSSQSSEMRDLQIWNYEWLTDSLTHCSALTDRGRC